MLGYCPGQKPVAEQPGDQTVRLHEDSTKANKKRILERGLVKEWPSYPKSALCGINGKNMGLGNSVMQLNNSGEADSSSKDRQCPFSPESKSSGLPTHRGLFPVGPHLGDRPRWNRSCHLSRAPAKGVLHRVKKNRRSNRDRIQRAERERKGKCLKEKKKKGGPKNVVAKPKPCTGRNHKENARCA